MKLGIFALFCICFVNISGFIIQSGSPSVSIQRISNRLFATAKASTETLTPATPKTMKINGYMLYCSKSRPAIIAANPKFSFAEVGKKMGEMWNSLSDPEKMKWKQLANSTEPIVTSAKSQKKKNSKSTEDSPRSKKLTGYMLYFAKSRQALIEGNSTLSFTEIGKKMGEMWQALPDSEKTRWKQLANSTQA